VSVRPVSGPQASLRSQSSGYVPSLDGLRAVGIILVFVHHLITPLPFGGAVGVDIFFVLSGYLITSILLREYDRHGRISLRRFYLRRAARLYPALLTVMVILFVPGLLFAPSIKAYLVENALAATYTTPIALQVSDTAAWAWRHTWSLGIEEMFYLLWPVLLIGVLTQKRVRAHAVLGVTCIGLILLAAGVALEAAGEPESLLLRSGGLFLGCALALRTMRSSGRAGGWVSSSKTAWIGASIILGAVVLASMDGALALPVLLTVLGSTAILAHITSGSHGRLARLLSWAPLTYTGKISYELYLWHYPLLIISSWALDADPLSVAIVVGPLSIVAAATTHHVLTPWVERLKSRASA
jgi:peptidoglycan/LPS O-acetylase OafA/YrhL